MVKGKQSERIHSGMEALQETGWTIHSHALGYHDWFFSRAMTHKQQRLLNTLFSFLTHGKESADPWETRVSMQQVAQAMGVGNETLSKPLKNLINKEIQCPICQKTIAEGFVSSKRTVYGRYILNLKPYLMIADHLQSHYLEDGESFGAAKNIWLQNQSSKLHKSQMDTINENKITRDGKVIYVTKKQMRAKK